MARPRFNLKNRKEDHTLIVLVYRYRNKKLVHSTGCTVSPKFWNDKTMRVRETAGNLEFGIINDHLDRLEEKLSKVHREFRRSGSDPSIKQLKDFLNSGSIGASVSKSMTVHDFIQQFIDERKISPRYKPGTIQTYATVQKHFNSYRRSENVEFSDLNREYLEGFIEYLYHQNFCDNHVNKIFTTLKTILNEATERGLNSNTAYKSRKLQVPKRDTDAVYLSEDELKRLSQIDLTSNPRLDCVRDLFLLGAWTGLRYSDFSLLTDRNIRHIDGIDVFEVNTVKTDNKVIIPIHPEVRKILDKRGGPPKPISNQKLNKYLKEVCHAAGIEDKVVKRSYRGGTRRQEEFFKWQLVGSHTARRSFATNTYLAGIDAMSIMKITGHKKYEMFMKYIKVSKQQNAVLMAQHEFFMKAL